MFVCVFYSFWLLSICVLSVFCFFCLCLFWYVLSMLYRCCVIFMCYEFFLNLFYCLVCQRFFSVLFMFRLHVVYDISVLFCILAVLSVSCSWSACTLSTFCLDSAYFLSAFCLYSVFIFTVFLNPTSAVTLFFSLCSICVYFRFVFCLFLTVFFSCLFVSSVSYLWSFCDVLVTCSIVSEFCLCSLLCLRSLCSLYASVFFLGSAIVLFARCPYSVCVLFEPFFCVPYSSVCFLSVICPHFLY